MRLWSLNPAYLDAKGLVALWREGLLAKAVLEGKTRGYKNHPQLERFKSQLDPMAAINAYLWAVVDEAEQRGYRFDAGKLDLSLASPKIQVTESQLRYEWEHLQAKLIVRDEKRFRNNESVQIIRPHPVVEIVPGTIEAWERNLSKKPIQP